MPSGGLYEDLDRRMRETCGPGPGFPFRTSAGRLVVDAGRLQMMRDRHAVLRAFFARVIDLFRSSLNGDLEPEVAALLLNEVPQSLGWDYHRSLQDEHWTVPLFFRTDEGPAGEIVEIQCPGSSWGEMVLLDEYHQGSTGSPRALTEFVAQVRESCGDSPVVLHLEDNASAPYGVRYLKCLSSSELPHFGLTRGIRSIDCNVIRSHSFQSLMAENLARERLRSCAEGRVVFDLPPHVTFDQKVPLVLPFWELTRQHFTDEMRALFPYSSLVVDGEIILSGDGQIALDDVFKLPRSRRDVYVKYAGNDVSLNWGSRGVSDIRKGGERVRKRVAEIARSSSLTRPWMVQRSVRGSSAVSPVERLSGNTLEAIQLPAKYSGYFGPAGLIGASAMHRLHTKVHGQEDTVFSVLDAAE